LRRCEVTGEQLRIETLKIAEEYAAAGLVSNDADRGAEVDKIENLFGTEGEPWCAMFVLWCAIKAIVYNAKPGSDISFGLAKRMLGQDIIPSPSCGALVADAKRRGIWKDGHADLQKGDWVFYDWDGTGTPEHVEIVVTYSGGSVMNTVGGNTTKQGGGGSQGEGHGVYLRQRPLVCVIGRARVGL
jgi:hypothetical protein